MELRVRPTSVLIENGKLCIAKQWVTPKRRWSLPGGKLETDETIEQCLVREMQEETGLDVRPGEMLYVTDRFFSPDVHIVHMTFLVARPDRRPLPDEWRQADPAPSLSASKLREIRMVPLESITEYGFTPVFRRLALAGFPDRGYKGDYNNFYGDQP